MKIYDDENNITNELDNTTVDINEANVEHDDTINTENLLQIDIRSKQEMMNKRASSLVLSQVDNMEIDLFHLLKAFNDPLIFFDFIIDWFK